MRILFLIASLCITLLHSAAGEPRIYTVHADHLPVGAPKTDCLIFGHLFAISFNTDTKVATWCCYRATAADQAGRNAPGRNWISPIPELMLESSDFAGGPYDIGHLTPLATFKASPFAWELNLLANCAPQTAQLNRGPWLKLERAIREIAASESVDVVVGPLFEKRMKPLPAADEPHQVPSHFWAVVATPESRQCWIIPQDCGRTDSLDQFASTVSELESRSGLAFPRGRN